jgi:hypothetical protein
LIWGFATFLGKHHVDLATVKVTTIHVFFRITGIFVVDEFNESEGLRLPVLNQQD